MVNCIFRTGHGGLSLSSSWQIGALAGTSFSPSSRPPVTGSRMSSADPRTKFKPTGFLGLNTASTANNNVDINFNLKRTVQNSARSSSFVQQKQQQPIQQPSIARAKLVFGASSPTAVQPTPPSTQFKFGGASFSPQHSSTSHQSLVYTYMLSCSSHCLTI